MKRRVWLALLALPVPLSGQSVSGPSTRAAALDAFEAEFVEYDRSFSDEARGEARRELASLRGASGAMTDAEFELALARIGALSGNGHSGLLSASWSATQEPLAVRFLIADDGLWVADARPAYESLVGARVAEVEGRTLDALRQVWSRYSTGAEGFRDQTLLIFMETPVMLHAAGVAARPTSVRLTLADGRAVEVGTTSDWPRPEGIWRYLARSRVLLLAQGGRIAGDPLYVQEPESTFRLVELPARDAVYVQFRANIDFTGRTDLRAQANAAIGRLRELAPRYVIVDQRFNTGGDLNTTRDLMRAIPEIVGPTGHVYAITSGRTFSAGISSMGYLKQASGDRLTIVGAPVGDALEFWAEGDPVRLPTGQFVLRATERHNYRTGCPEEDCHGSIRQHPIAIDTLEPDVRPRFDYADVVAGRDPWLEEVLRRIDAARSAT